MKTKLKTYLSVTALTILCAGIPWILAWCGILTKLDALGLYSIPFAIAATTLLVICVIKYGKGVANRLAMLLLNPVIYYLVFLLAFAYMFSREPWDGFKM